MLVFPQFATGAATLYPLTKQSALRTVVNTLGDGSTVVFSDPDAALTSWEIRAKGLTFAEWNAVEALFAAVSGQWQTFTFLDPAGNLLADSEDLGAGAWTNGALIQLTTGIADPFGTSRATRVVNAGIAAEAVAQTLSVPGNVRYCLSVWARTVGGSSVTLTASTTGASSGLSFVLSGAWVRDCFAGGSGAEHQCGDIRGSVGCRGFGGFVWDAGGGTAGGFGLQDDGGERRRVFGGSVCG